MLAAAFVAVADAAVTSARRLDAAALPQLRVSEPGPWALVVVDAHRRNSEAYLAALRSNGYEGRHALVVVTGDAATAQAFARRTYLLPQAQWTVASAGHLREQLGLGGAPAVFGIDAQQRVVWQSAGLPARAGDLAVRIADWTGAVR